MPQLIATHVNGVTVFDARTRTDITGVQIGDVVVTGAGVHRVMPDLRKPLRLEWICTVEGLQAYLLTLDDARVNEMQEQTHEQNGFRMQGW